MTARVSSGYGRSGATGLDMREARRARGSQVTQRVLIAADKFKGSLTAVEVAERVMACLLYTSRCV